jgi:hypothetical protein
LEDKSNEIQGIRIHFKVQEQGTTFLIINQKILEILELSRADVVVKTINDIDRTNKRGITRLGEATLVFQGAILQKLRKLSKKIDPKCRRMTLIPILRFDADTRLTSKKQKKRKHQFQQITLCKIHLLGDFLIDEFNVVQQECIMKITASSFKNLSKIDIQQICAMDEELNALMSQEIYAHQPVEEEESVILEQVQVDTSCGFEDMIPEYHNKSKRKQQIQDKKK